MSLRGKLLEAGKRGGVLLIAMWLSLLSPAVALAQEAVDAAGNSTGAPENTGAPVCTGAGCGQGADQGIDQGGPSLEDLGGFYDEEGNVVLPAGVADVRQGAGNGVAGSNTDTGAGSTNSVDVDSDSSNNTSVNNSVTDTNDVDAAGNTGGNTQNKNTGAGGITTGDANIGVTQVINDNTATINGTAGLDVSGYNGNYDGDLTLDFGPGTAAMAGEGGLSSIRAINDGTGSDSTNAVDIDARTEEINEVQNDGLINNILNLAAITGQNEASKNTGDGAIATGDANVAATLVNLLNTTVINGDLWITVADIFGDLNGDIILPDLAGLAALLGSDLLIDAVNKETGSDSTNAIDIDVTDETVTNVDNKAEITTTIDAEAITGQNDTIANTGGGFVDTGDASVSASNISLANTTVEGGNWALVVVNALNSWLGFLVGDSGEVRALSQDETIREIEARNSGTGSDSDNTIDVDVENRRENTIANDAKINNEVTASAITGQNEAKKNTGRGDVATGDANVEVTTVNIANTTVVDGSLFIAVVNIFGDWVGDLIYGGQSLLASAEQGTVEVNGENSQTGAESENTIDVDIDRSRETDIDNEADITTTLNANVDTGSNRANRNTLGGGITTGDGVLGLHSRALANITGIMLDSPLSLTVTGLNDTTGFDSKNTIRARLNDERIVTVDNYANVSTIFGGMANTGDNEANQNTIGGNILTGDAAADVGINNLINRVMQVLAGGSGFAAGESIALDAELMNLLTGASSENSNEVNGNYDFLADIVNNGIVNNLVDLLLNTGGNTANENTDGGNILSGAGCVDGDIHNEVNNSSLVGLGSLNLANDADVNNEANIDVTTGDNETNRNTGSGQALGGADGICGEKLAVVVEELGEEENNDVGGGDVGSDEEGVGPDEGDVGPDEREPRVAAAVSKDEPSQPGGSQTDKNGVLKRFPVAGGEGGAMWLPGSKRSPWVAFALVASAVVLAAYHFDQQARQLGGRVNLPSRRMRLFELLPH